MQIREILLRVIAVLVVVTGLGGLLILDAENPSRERVATLSGDGEYQGAYSGETSLVPPQNQTAADPTGSVAGSVVDDSDAAISDVEVELRPLDGHSKD